MIDIDDLQGWFSETLPKLDCNGHKSGRDWLGRFKGGRDGSPKNAREALKVLLCAVESKSLVVGITYAGLHRLGLSSGLLGLFPDEFIVGAAARASALNDDPSTWDHGLDRNPPDLVLMSNNCIRPTTAIQFTDRRLEDKQSQFAKEGPSDDAQDDDYVSGHSERCVNTFLRDDGTEVFGFKDGTSNPPLLGEPGNMSFEGGVPIGSKTATPKWKPLAAGEIIFGYPNEAGVLPGNRALHGLLRNGSFLVWRKIEQNKVLFDQHFGCNAEKIMGRKKEDKNNKFGYSLDSAVSANSHIRRANPRNGEFFCETDENDPNRHRMIRRSRSYEEKRMRLDANHEMKEIDVVGMIFRCYQTSIAAQFEFVQSKWFNEGTQFRQGRTPDPIVGQPGKYGKSDSDPIPITTVLGTVYAFVPSISVLTLLAETPCRWSDV